MSTQNIDFRHLRYFLCVVDQGSFSAASAHLHISQPALTRQVQQVEELLGQTLLVRKARGVELTDAGRIFYAEARKVTAMMDQAVSRSKLAGEGEIGRLEIGMFGSAVFAAVPRIVKAFKDRFPGVQISLHTMDRPEQMAALRDRRLNLGFDSCFDQESDIKWTTIQRERFKIAVHESHALAGKASLSLADIEQEPLILYPRIRRPHYGTSMLTLFHRRQLSPQNMQEVDDFTTAVALVSHGFGVTLVTESACTLQIPGVVYRPIPEKDRAQFDICMMYRNDDQSALLGEFIRVASRLGTQARAPRRSSASSPSAHQPLSLK